MKIVAKLVIDPRTKCLGYYRDGKFVKILSRREYEELKIIKKEDYGKRLKSAGGIDDN